MIVLSPRQAGPLPEARATAACTARASPDLELTLVDVSLTPDGVVFPDEPLIPWSALALVRRGRPEAFGVVASKRMRDE